MGKKITAYLGVFEGKLEKLNEQIKKAEKEGNPVSEGMLKEARSLAKTLEDMQEHDTAQVQCPCCGEKFKVDAGKVKLKTS